MNTSVRLTTLATWVLWIGGGLAILGDYFGILHEDAAFVGLAALAFGHLIVMGQCIQRLEQREQSAFELGRAVRPLRND